MKLSGNLAQVTFPDTVLYDLVPWTRDPQWNVWSDLVLEVIIVWPSSLSLNSPWPSLSFYLELSSDLPFLRNKWKITFFIYNPIIVTCHDSFPIIIKVTKKKKVHPFACQTRHSQNVGTSVIFSRLIFWMGSIKKDLLFCHD